MYLNLCQGDRKVFFSFCFNGVSHEGGAALARVCLEPVLIPLSRDTGIRELSFRRAVRRAQEDTFALVLKLSSTLPPLVSSPHPKRGPFICRATEAWPRLPALGSCSRCVCTSGAWVGDLI